MTNLLNSTLSSQELSALQQALTREQTRRRESNRLQAYQPYPKQTEFHAFGATCKQRLLRAGNQQGKTFSGAMEMAMHLTGLYPDWWPGRRFDHPVDPQRALLGPLGHWGTGAIPERTIMELKRGRGVADLLDIVLVKHKSGGMSKLGFKRYDQGREAWQGPAKHVIWCDEEPPEDIYNEALARLIATRGMIYTTFTPLLGLSNVVKRLIDANDGVTCADINMTIEDALHIREEDHARIMSGFPEHERDARIKGVPLMGTGRVFPIHADRIRCQAFAIPDDWPLKVFDHLADWFYEFEHYHRDQGLIVKKNDDLLSATRIALMMITFATTQEPDGFTSGQTDINWNVFQH